MLHASERKAKTLFRKIQKPSAAVVNAGAPDTKYLHYPLDMAGVTLKCSLLPA